MNAIETNKLTKKFKTKTAVDGLDLTVGQGELFALLGVNGAGKSTTIKMLSCLAKPSAGDARLMGHSVTDAQLKVKQIINVSPQETAVAPNLTVRENLELIAGIYGNDREKAKIMTDEIIERFAMGEIAKDRAKTLSGGWQRRLSIAMALVSEPQVLFLDEPTLGLDVIARRELWHLIGRLKGKITIILTTHYLEEAESLADRIGIMAKGKLRAVGTPSELKKMANTESFEDAFISLAGEECVL